MRDPNRKVRKNEGRGSEMAYLVDRCIDDDAVVGPDPDPAPAALEEDEDEDEDGAVVVVAALAEVEGAVETVPLVPGNEGAVVCRGLAVLSN